MKESLDQRRARFAWEKVQGQGDEYTRIAKSAPVLIMQSGLMATLAFLHDKNQSPLLEHLCEWLNQQPQFKGRIASAQFSAVMDALMGRPDADAAEHARFYQHATAEALSLLRWIRQFAAVRQKG